jgi:hypothetical protein
MSNLEKAIQDWRRAVLAKGATADDVAELEAHARDQVVDLEGKGLDTDEAFLIAFRRLGTPDELGAQFGIVPREGNRRRAARALASAATKLLALVGLVTACSAVAVYWPAPSQVAAPIDPSAEVYYEVYGLQTQDAGWDYRDSGALLGTSADGVTFDLTGFRRFVIVVPPTSGRVAIDALGLGDAWVDSRPGEDYRHSTGNFRPSGVEAASAWEQGDHWTEGPPDGQAFENTPGVDSWYSFSTGGETALTVYLAR